MNNLLKFILTSPEKASLISKSILGEGHHILIKDDKGNVIFNPSKFKLPKKIRVTDINGDKIIHTDNKFYKIETAREEYNEKTFEVLRINDYTNIIETVRALQSDDKTGTLRPDQFIKEIKKMQHNLNIKNIPFCIAMIDIDNFKSINDTYGHIYGDRKLKEVAEILSMTLREGDAIGRFGGDEFIIAISQVKEEDVQELFNNRIIPRLKNEVGISISAGVKSYENTLSYKKNKKLADMALYIAKRNGKGTIVTFEPWMEEKSNLTLEDKEHLI